MSKKTIVSDTTLTAEVNFLDLKNHIITLRNALALNPALTDADVTSMNKISDSDKTYIADCLTEAANAQDLVPAYFSVEDIRKEDQLNDSLYEVEDMLLELYQDVKRNRMAAADRAYSGVSNFYGLVKAAADANVPKAIAIHKRMQEYHKRKVEMGKNRRKKEEAVRQTAIATKMLQSASTN
jgi:hypothetical protein